MDSAWKFLTVIVAVVGAWIAYRQHFLAREKFKLDLFEKRFAVFSAVRTFLSHIMSEGKLDYGSLATFRGATAEASFLFGDDMTSYIGEIDTRAMRMKKLAISYKDMPIGDQRSQLVEEESQELVWLIDQLPMLKSKFEPYLKFRLWH